MAQSPNDLYLRNEAGVVYSDMSRVLAGLGRYSEAGSANTRAIAIFEKLAGADPANRDYRDGLANSYAQRGTLANVAGNLQEGLRDFRKNLEIRQSLAAELPNSPAAQRNLMLAYSRLGDVVGYPGLPNLGDREQAIGYFRQCLAITQTISAADPTDQIARFDVSMARLRLAITLADTKAREETLQMFQTGLAETERLLAADPQNRRYLLNGAIYRQMLGDQFRRQGNDQAAIVEYERSLALTDHMRGRDPSDGGGWLVPAEATLTSYSQLVGRMGDRTRAAALEKRIIELADRAKSSSSALYKEELPLLYSALGEMRLALGEVERARSWLQKSAEGWQNLQSGGNISTLHTREPARVAALLARIP